MKRYALTGNMGCGKTTVLGYLAKYPDVLTIDCDKLAKGILCSGQYRNALIEILGPQSFEGDKPNTKLIARLVFENAKTKQRLESFVHPLVWRLVDELISKSPNAEICVVESAVVFETSCEDLFDAVIVVTCDPQDQARRLTEKRGLTLADVDGRLSHQMSSAEKVNRSNFRIDTSCNLEELERRVEKLYERLKERKKT